MLRHFEGKLSPTIVALVGRYGSAIVMFMIFVVLTRRLSNHEFGVFVVAFGIAATMFYFAGFGAPDGAVRVVVEALALNDISRAAGAVGSLLKAGWVTVAVWLALAVAAFLLRGKNSPVPFVFAWIASWSLLFTVAQGLLALGRERAGSLFFYAAGSWSMVVTVLPYTVLVSVPNSEGAIAAAALGCGGASLIGLAMLRREQRQLEFSGVPRNVLITELCTVGFPFAATRVVTMAFLWSVTWAIAMFQGPAAAGIVGTTMQVAAAIGAPLAAFRFVIRPKLVRLWTLQDMAALKTMSVRVSVYASGGAVVAMLAATLLGQTFLSFFFGSSFSTAGPILLFGLIALLGDAITGVADDIMRVANRANRVLLVQVTLIVMVVPAIFILARTGVLPAIAAFACYSFIFGGAMLLWSAKMLQPTSNPEA
jgi:O-antigen/teichoic acid export membrane protein